MKNYICVGAPLLLALCTLGCLPTVDPAKAVPAPPAPAAPAVVPEAAIPVAPMPTPDAPATPQTPKPTQLPAAKLSTTTAEDGVTPETHMKMLMLGEAAGGAGNATLKVEPKGDGLFAVSGGKALTATITRQPDGGWVLDGTITFPAKGYVVDSPFATSLDTMRGVTLEKSTDVNITTITIPFSYPAKVDRNAMEAESFPLKLTFPAPAATQFIVMLLPGQGAPGK